VCAVAVFHDVRGVLVGGQNHLVTQKPVAHSAGISLRVTVDRYVGTGRRADQLIRHEDHRGDWKNVSDR